MSTVPKPTSVVTTIVVRGHDQAEMADAVAHAMVAWLAGWKGLHEPDDSDDACERLLKWLQE